MLDLSKMKKFWVGDEDRFNSLIMTAAIFPVDIFEEFICEPVLEACYRYRDVLPVEIKDGGVRLCAEENNHRNHHRVIRKKLEELGYDLNEQIVALRKYLDQLRLKSLEAQLAFSAVMECKISISSGVFLDDPYLLSNPKGLDMLEFLHDHAVEEIGHYYISPKLYFACGYSKSVLLKAIVKYSMHSFKEYHCALGSLLKGEDLNFTDRLRFYRHYMVRMWIGGNPILSKTAIGMFKLFINILVNGSRKIK